MVTIFLISLSNTNSKEKRDKIAVGDAGEDKVGTLSFTNDDKTEAISRPLSLSHVGFIYAGLGFA